MSSKFNRAFSTVKISRKGLSDLTPKTVKKNKLNRQKIIGLVVLFILMCVSVWSIMERADLQEVPRLIPNQTANATIYAAIPFTCIDQEKMEQQRQDMLSQFPLFFRLSQSDTDHLEAELQKFKQAHKKDLGESLCDQFSKEILYAVDEGVMTASDVQKYQWRTFRFEDVYGRSRTQQRRISDLDSLANLSERIVRKISDDSLSDAEVSQLKKTAERMLGLGVLKYDEELTRKRHEQMMSDISLAVQYKVINRGEVLLRKGATVTEHDVIYLKQYARELEKVKSFQNSKSDWIRLSQSICISFLLVLFTAIYIKHIHPEVLESGNKIWVLGLTILFALLLNILFVKLFAYLGEQFSIPPKLWYLALPIGFAPIVIGILIGVRTALFSGLFISLVASFSGMNQFNMVVFGMVVSALASYMVKGCLNYRSLLLRGFFTLTIVSSVLVVIFCWRDGTLREVMPWPLILPVAVSIATIVMVQFALVFMESIFDLTSKISLNLYSDYNHPLLKEMQINAPGTYHHSLVVSILAEAAAEAIGADPIRARIGALFHDVGKTAQAEYFTENSNGENLHEKLTPQESALVITNHIREGMKLAREYKLKRPIREAIEQHHGTDLVYYFYKQAKDRGDYLKEEDFRYSGPRPRSKETAILSLADACEAASRSLERPTHEQVSEMVSAIIQKRLREGQLDECALTFRELTMIRESFIKSLTSMLHARIAYPKDEENEDENDLFVDAERKASAEKKS